MPTNAWQKAALITSLVFLGGSAGFAARPSQEGRQESKEEAKTPVLDELSDDEDAERWRDYLDALEPEPRREAIRESWFGVSEIEEAGASPLLETPELKEPRVERKEEVNRRLLPAELAAIEAAHRAGLAQYLAGASMRRALANARVQAEMGRRRAERLATSALATETPQARAARQAAMSADRAARGLAPTHRNLFE